MAYKVELLPQAIEDLHKLDKTIARRVIEKLEWLSENFDTIKPDSLTGQLKGLLKFRVGTYRIIYNINKVDKIISVHMIGHRKDIYKLK